MKLVVVVVDEEHLALPHLVNLGRDELAHPVLIFIVEGVVLKLENLAGKGLAKGKDGTAAELGEVDRF